MNATRLIQVTVNELHPSSINEVKGLTMEQMAYRPTLVANNINFLVSTNPPA